MFFFYSQVSVDGQASGYELVSRAFNYPKKKIAPDRRARQVDSYVSRKEDKWNAFLFASVSAFLPRLRWNGAAGVLLLFELQKLPVRPTDWSS